MRAAIDALQDFMTGALTKIGVPEADAALVADNLATAEKWGVYSHGVGRFPVYYARTKSGAVNPAPRISIVRRYPCVAAVDGDNGFGAIATMAALREACEIADRFGIGFAAVRNSNHLGAAGYYCQYAANHGYICMISSVGPANMPPFGAAEAYFSTNPFAVGFPVPDKPSVVVDMATSIAAKGKIRAAARQGANIPAGWAIDRDGNPTTDPQSAIDGLVLPMAGHKGSAIALAIEYLSGVMSGSGFGTQVGMQYGDDAVAANVGHSLVVLKNDAVMEASALSARTARMYGEIKALKPAAGFSEILLPGENEARAAEKCEREGVLLDETLVKSLEAICAETETPLCFLPE